MLTPETLTRHELAGLHAEVVDAPNPDLVGVAGRVVRETTRTLVLRGGDGETQVPKAGSDVRFALPSDGDVTAVTAPTDEAAGGREAPGSASELPSETADATGAVGQSGGCEGVVYVTVDGGRLLSRPARRTENTGDNTWR